MSVKPPSAYGLLSELSRVKEGSKPPIDQWNPALRYPIEMNINSRGEWFYEGSMIARPRLVRLFASVLKRIDADYYLVTPAEACQITVADAPFIGIGLECVGAADAQVLTLSTNVGDEVEISAEHPLSFRENEGALIPYVSIRQGLAAKLNRSTYYELMQLLVESNTAPDRFGIWSHGAFFEVSDNDADC